MIIKVQNLTKSFNTLKAVDDVSLSIEQGDIFGILGPNGAGKTTMIKMLATLLPPSSGRVSIMGYDAVKDIFTVRRHIGYVSQYFGLYEELTVEENVDFYASLYQVPDSERLNGLIKKYDLHKYRKTKAGALSGGTQRRLSLVCALTHDPELIFLDEPTAGVDPVTRKALWDSFFDLKNSGKTIFVATHYMEEALRCDHLAFFSEGKIVAQGSVEEILARLDDKNTFVVASEDIKTSQESLLRHQGVLFTNQFGNELRVVTEKTIKQETLESFEAVSSVVPIKPTLEEVFIALTKERR